MFVSAQRRVALLACLLCLTTSFSYAQSEIKGQRVYFSGHSFHYFMPPILADIARKANIKDHTQVGLSAIGGSRVYQHWSAPQTFVAKAADAVALPSEKITVVSTAAFPKAGTIVLATPDGEVEIAYADKTPTAFTGCTGGKGILKSGTKIAGTTNAAREALKAGKLDVFTMAPIYLPDDGIEKFVKLGVENNPKIRIFVQENWLPWDHYDAAFKPPVAKVDHNAPTVEALRKIHAPYFKSIDEHVVELNKKYNTSSVRVAPVGQAVMKLREKIIAGAAPGLKEQNDLFADPIGHARPPLQALVAYCYYALIYEKSPVGLPTPAVLSKTEQSGELNELLQRIAWEAVTAHPLSGVEATKK